jgi:hypothetical protein
MAKRNNVVEENDAKPIWESLYKLNNEKKMWMEQKRLKAEEQQRIKEETNLTFKPQINSGYQMHDPRVTVYERSQLYMRNEKQNEELERKRIDGNYCELSLFS